MQNKVVRDVIDDDRFRNVSPQQAQVFHKERTVLTRVLTIESVFDVVTDIDLIDNLIGILLQRCSKDDDLIVARHRFNELHAARSDQEEAVVLILRKITEGKSGA